MPGYKHRPALAGDTAVWRYLDLPALLETIRIRQLRMTRIDRSSDPFEGSVPKRQIDDQVPLFSGTTFMQMTMVNVASWTP
jgi:hypothetical protein